MELSEAVRLRERLLVVVAGPNGAGKSNFVEAYLGPCDLPFVNADLIARTLDPEAPAELAYAAAAAADQVRGALVEQGVSFCMETVFSDASGTKLTFLRRARARGYTVVLVFIGLENPELCIGRVSQRVAEGGHDVPDEAIRSRYPRSLANLRAALEFVDHAFLFDNSSCDAPYRHVATLRAGRVERRAAALPDWTADQPALGREPSAPRPRRRREARTTSDPRRPPHRP